MEGYIAETMTQASFTFQNTLRAQNAQQFEKLMLLVFLPELLLGFLLWNGKKYFLT